MDYYNKTVSFAVSLLGDAHEVTKSMKESCGNAIESLKKMRDESKTSLSGSLVIKDPYGVQKKKEIKAKYEKYKKELGKEMVPYKIEAEKKKDIYGYRDLKKLVRLMTPRKSTKLKESL